MLSIRKKAVFDRDTPRESVIRSDDGMQFDSITVTVLLHENSGQRRAWRRAFTRHGFAPPVACDVVGYWSATLSALGLTATLAGTDGDAITFSVRGPVASLAFLVAPDYFPLLPTEVTVRTGSRVSVEKVAFAQGSAPIPRGGRPQDYVSIGTAAVPQTLYAPSPHGHIAPKRPATKKKPRKTRDANADQTFPYREVGYTPDGRPE